MKYFFENLLILKARPIQISECQKMRESKV